MLQPTAGLIHRCRHHNRQAKRFALAAITTTCAAVAHAEGPPIKPGLWEITSDSQQLNGQPLPDMSARMAEAMKNLSPQMRDQMQAQMKAHGVQIAPAGDSASGVAVRLFITRDMLDQNRWMKTDGQCQNTALTKTGATWNWKFKCTQPPSEGEGSTTFQASDAYVTDMRTTTQRNGQAQTLTMKHHGKWLSADCGDVRPLGTNATTKP